MRSCTSARNAFSWSLVSEALFARSSRYLRERSMRDIFRRPQAWQTETAFVDQAVVKFMRGPTSRVELVVGSWELGVRNEASENFSGSKVSARSQRSRRDSSGVSGLFAAMLKQNSVWIAWIAGETFS